MDTLQINSLKQWLSIKFIELGVAQIRQVDTDISTKNDSSALLVSSLVAINPIFSPVLLDSTYYYTSFANWQTIISLMNDITKTFPWESERFDCDKRANLIASMIALIFRLNTCMTVYCEVSSAANGQVLYQHYANIIVDDNGIAYLWDLDNGGMYQKITGNDMIMGKVKYHFYSIRTI